MESKTAEEILKEKTNITFDYYEDVVQAMQEFSNQQNAKLVENNKKLYEALLALIDNINPHSFPIQTWRETDFSNDRIGSKDVGLPDNIVINAVRILKETE